MNHLALKRLAIGAGTVAATGIAVVAYSFAVKSVDAFAIGGILTLTGLQCAMNVHLALRRNPNANGDPLKNSTNLQSKTAN